jgi:hypothetical protein
MDRTFASAWRGTPGRTRREVLVAAGVEGQGPPQGQRRELLARLPRVNGLVADALRLAQLWLLELRPYAAGRSVRAAVAEPSLARSSWHFVTKE